MPDTQISEEMVERGAKSVARMIPTDGGRWNPGYGENFPQEYTKQEITLIRSIARTVLEAALSGHAIVPREPTQAMREAAAYYLGTVDIEPTYRAMIQAAPPVPEMEG